MTLRILDFSNDAPDNPNGIVTHWQDSDFAQMHDRERYDRAFSKTPFIFNFTCRPSAEFGSSLPKRRHPENKDSITVSLRTNVSGNRIPLTPWILAHRLGHALQLWKDIANQSQYEVAIMRELSGLVDSAFGSSFQDQIDSEMPNTCRLLNVGKLSFDVVVGNGGTVAIKRFVKGTELFAHCMTTRCARNNVISTEVDIYPELLAQYVIQGRVTLRTPKATVELGAIPASNGGLGHTVLFNTRQVSDQRLHETEDNINRLFGGLLTKLTGHHLAL